MDDWGLTRWSDDLSSQIRILMDLDIGKSFSRKGPSVVKSSEDIHGNAVH